MEGWVGSCTASIFQNEIKTENGPATVKSVSLQRTYKDKDDEFKHTSSFRVNDIPKAILTLNMAYEHVTSEERA